MLVPFTPSPGVIQPLFFLAQKCRHPLFRRRAIALLRGAGIEGPFNGSTEAAIAQRIVEIEEDRPYKSALGEDDDILLLQDIPDSRRIISCCLICQGLRQRHAEFSSAMASPMPSSPPARTSPSSHPTKPNSTPPDVRDEAHYTQTLLSLAPVDHIVFSAVDTIIRGKLADQDLDAAKHLFGVKFWGAVLTGKVVANGGSLTLTSGTAGLKPGRDAAIGGALNGESKSRGIRVNTVVPGLVKTALWDKLGKTAAEQDELFRGAAAKLPVGFVATPRDVAEAYLYAIRSEYTTGKLIEIDGGVLL
ncbi:hypothetical protein DV735_g4285, partial [Chaetothyriales sp. CBS 134920]